MSLVKVNVFSPGDAKLFTLRDVERAAQCSQFDSEERGRESNGIIKLRDCKAFSQRWATRQRYNSCVHDKCQDILCNLCNFNYFPSFWYRLQTTVPRCIVQQQQSTISYLFGLEIVCVYLSVSCSRCALHAVVVHIFSKIMCTRSFTLFTIHIPIRVESFAERCFVSELLASPFLAPLIASSVQHRHQQHCANYLNTLCMHAVKYFDVFGMVFFEQQQPRQRDEKKNIAVELNNVV